MINGYQRLSLATNGIGDAILPTELFEFRCQKGEWNKLKAAADLSNVFFSVLSREAFDQMSLLSIKKGRPNPVLQKGREYIIQYFPIDVRVAFGNKSLFSRFECAVIENGGKILGEYDIYLSTSVLQSIGTLYSNKYNAQIEHPKLVSEVLQHPICRQKNVVIIGKDTGEGLLRMKLIENVCRKLCYNPIILKDYEEIVEANLEQKFLAIASNSRFIICDNTFPSGHIDELKICFANSFLTSVLQEKKHSATWMQANYSYDSNMVNLREYISDIKSISPKELCLTDAAIESILWAESRVRERTEYLNKLYQWRQNDRKIELYMLQEFLRNWYDWDLYKLKPWQTPIDTN